MSRQENVLCCCLEQMMSRSEGQEGVENPAEVLQPSESPTDIHSSSAMAELDSSSRLLTVQSDGCAPTESTGPVKKDMDSDLDSAESSAVSLTDVPRSSHHGQEPPGDPSMSQEVSKDVASSSSTISPLAQEVLVTSSGPGRSSSTPQLSLSVTRSLSGDCPPSPLFVPKNPFLDLGGKITKFKWTTTHINLLEKLLVSISGILDKWKR